MSTDDVKQYIQKIFACKENKSLSYFLLGCGLTPSLLAESSSLAHHDTRTVITIGLRKRSVWPGFFVDLKDKPALAVNNTK